MTPDEYFQTLADNNKEDSERYACLKKLIQKRKEYNEKFGEGAIDDAIYMDPLEYDGSNEAIQDIIDSIDKHIRKGKPFMTYSEIRRIEEETGEPIIF